jgi:DNA (cytosine-5)-methyltransferase 1
MDYRLNTLSLFSGGGGLDLGFSAAGYTICCATDIDDYSCKTLEINKDKKEYLHHFSIIKEDITSLTTEALLNKTNHVSDEIDVIIGGPPCQAFSVFGRRKGLGDPRGSLVWEFLRVVEDIQPKVFVFENVQGIRTIHNGDLYNQILEDLSIDGLYSVSDHHYELAEFGIPQFRSRIFFIGVNNGNPLPKITPTHGPQNSQPDMFSRKPFITVQNILDDLPEPGKDCGIHNHVGRNHSDRIIHRYRNLKFGERDPKTRINKLHPERPSFTIIVGSDAGGGKGHVHPYSPREVTPRESARIQTFPDWWEFSGTGRHVIRQVGNAVPPLFAALLAEHIKRNVFEIDSRIDYDEFLDILELDFLKR